MVSLGPRGELPPSSGHWAMARSCPHLVKLLCRDRGWAFHCVDGPQGILRSLALGSHHDDRPGKELQGPACRQPHRAVQTPQERTCDSVGHIRVPIQVMQELSLERGDVRVLLGWRVVPVPA